MRERAFGEPIRSDLQYGVPEYAVFDQIQQGRSDLDYEMLLELARTLHPEAHCIKHVPAAAVLETPRGTIFMFSINGRPQSTPAHAREYMPANLARLANNIPAHAPERIPLISAIEQAPADRPLSCFELRDLAQTDYCLKGFQFGQSVRATRLTADFCPNSRAGCTERILLNWAPYAVALQERTGFDTLVIPDMTFLPNDPTALVHFAPDIGVPFTECEIPPPPGGIPPDVTIRMMSQILPCTTCATEMVRAGVAEVCIRELSQYVVPETGVVLVDDDDLWSVDHFTHHGVALVCNSPHMPVLRH